MSLSPAGYLRLVFAFDSGKVVTAKYCMVPKGKLGVNGCDKILIAGSQTSGIRY